MADLYFYRDPQEARKEKQAVVEAKAPKDEYTGPSGENWNDA